MKNASCYPGKPGFSPQKPLKVGGVCFAEGVIHYNEERPTTTLRIRNTGDRPIQVGSHFHLFEANRYLQFDREAAFGCHLNIPATTAIRFEPGDERSVEVVPFSGKQRIVGFNGLVQGYSGGEQPPCYSPTRSKALRRIRELGFCQMGPREAEMKSSQTTKK